MASFMTRFRLGPIPSGGRDASRRRRLLRFESLEDRALLSFAIDRIALDSSGDAYTVGTLNGQFNFDPAGSTAGVVSASVQTAVVAKYSPSNTLLWVKSFTPGSDGASASAATGVAVSNSTGAIYVTGYFSGTVDLSAGGNPSDMVSSNGGTDGFIVELAPGGSLEPGGARTFGASGNDTADAIALSSDGTTVFVSGEYQGTVNFDPGGANTSLTSPSATEPDSFMMRLTSNLGFQTVAALGQTDTTSVRLAVDGTGDAYLVGAIGSSGGSTIYDAFVAKFDPNGNLVTVRTFGGPSSGGIHAAAIGVATDGAGNIYVDGFFSGTGINFDSAFGTGNVPLDAAGNTDTFVIKLDSNFDLLWARRFGTSGQGNPDDLAFDNQSTGSVYVTGINSPGEASFGTTGAGTNILDNNTGTTQSYVLLIDSNGNAISATPTSGVAATSPLNVAINGQGHVIVAGVNPAANNLFLGTPEISLSPTPAPTPTTTTPTPLATTTPTPTPPPTFLGEHRTTMKVKKKKVLEFVLTFNGALRSANAPYQVTQPGRTKKSAPKHVGVTSMTLGPGGTSVILTLGSYTAAKPLTLMASGLTGANGAAVAAFVTGL